MSESTPDISKVISVIMQNPKLIEEISALMGKADKEEAPLPEPPKAEVIEEKKEELSPVSASPEIREGARSTDRKRLLGALKPYVSKERARAIDSMMSIVEILEAVRR